MMWWSEWVLTTTPALQVSGISKVAIGREGLLDGAIWMVKCEVKDWDSYVQWKDEGERI